MIQKLKKFLTFLRLKLMTLFYSPYIIKDAANNAMKKGNEKIEDKLLVPVANNANKVTKKLLKILLITFIVLVILLLISAAWDALSISISGVEIKSAKEVQ